MDGENFDELTRKLATAASRRRVLRGFLGSAAALGGLKATETLAAKQTKVDLCHRTASATNPYVQITVANPSTDLAPHLTHGDFYYVPGKTECCGPKDCPGTDQCNIQACVYSSETANDRSSYCGPITPRDNGTPCDDGKFCTVNDHCNGQGLCVGDARDCSDGVPCTTDTCDDTLDQCVHTPNNAFCEDGFSCTTNTCSPGEGADSNGCVTTPNDSACDDNYSCTTDTCDPANAEADPTTGCVNARVDSACDDGYSCTTDTCDPGNDGADADGCVHTANHTACDDGNICTDNACNPANATDDTGCVSINNSAICDDGKDCTINDVCSGGTCSGTVSCVTPPSACYASTGTCAADGSCEYTLLAAGTTCDDCLVCDANGACSVDDPACGGHCDGTCKWDDDEIGDGANGSKCCLSSQCNSGCCVVSNGNGCPYKCADPKEDTGVCQGDE